MDLHVSYWNSEKERVGVHFLNSLFMGKSAAADVLEHFNSRVESIEKEIFLQFFSDEPNVNLSFLKILDERRRDAELSPLIDLGICGLHTVQNLFKHGEKESNGTLRNFKIRFLNYLMKVCPFCINI